MNADKYQALLNELCSGCVLEDCNGGKANCDLYLGFKELVDKATPKKPVKNQYGHDACPNCGWIVYDTWNGDQRFIPHCENCGQALKWDEEEEDD